MPASSWIKGTVLYDPTGISGQRWALGDAPPPDEPDDSDRIERVIAISRLVLAVSALPIMLVDPRQRIYSTTILYGVLIAFIVYSAALLWLFRHRILLSHTSPRAILITDVAWFTAIVGLSEGGTSPFFLFYLFAVWTAAIRWGIRATVQVATLSAGLYLAVALVSRRLEFGPDFTMRSGQLMRPLYLVLIGYLVGFIGEHELSTKRRLIEMISMRREVSRSRSELFTLARLLRHMIKYFSADHVSLQLRLPDAPPIDWEGQRRSGRRLVIRNAETKSWSPAAAAPVSYRVSHVLGNWGRRVERFESGATRPVHLLEEDEPGFLSRSRMRSLISVPIRSVAGIRGRLLLGRARANFSREDLSFAQTLVAQAAIILDNVALQAKAEELAVAEERARIARDVHDGFVQSLASLDVGIEVCRRLEQKDPAKLADELADLQRTVKQGYRDARRYLDRLRDQHAQGPAVEEAVRELVREFREHTEIAVDVETAPVGLAARHGIGFEVLQIVREGLTNIVRHSGARTATIVISKVNGSLDVLIRDDGSGFPSAGYKPAELPTTAAPWSIRERVEALGGTLRLVSGSGRGSELHITLPGAD